MRQGLLFGHCRDMTLLAFVLVGCTSGFHRDDLWSPLSEEDTFVSESREEAEALRRIRSGIDAAQELARRSDVSEAERETLRRSVDAVRAALAHYEEVRDRGDAQAIIYAGVGTASSAIVADDVTIVGIGNDIGLVPLALLALATHILTDSRASPKELSHAWHQVGYRLQELAASTEHVLLLAAHGNHADTGIMEEVHALLQASGRDPKDYCTALKILMEEANRASDARRKLRIKATMKAKGCYPSRHSRE